MKHLALTMFLAAATAFPALAAEEEAAPLTPAMMEQVVMSEKLIAIGKERKDAILILAAIRLRSTLDGAAPAAADALTSSEDAFAAAMDAAAADEALQEIVKDVEASGSRRMPICARNGVCY